MCPMRVASIAFEKERERELLWTRTGSMPGIRLGHKYEKGIHVTEGTYGIPAWMRTDIS